MNNPIFHIHQLIYKSKITSIKFHFIILSFNLL